jgi:hypothetical protein
VRRVGRKVAIPVFRWVARRFRAIQIALWRINYILVFHLFAFRFGGSFSRRSFRPWTHPSVGRARPCDFRRAHSPISCLYYTGPLARVRASFPSRRRVWTFSSCPSMGHRRCAPSLRLSSFSACQAPIIPIMIILPSIRSLVVYVRAVPLGRDHHPPRLWDHPRLSSFFGSSVGQLV